jgi:hypothetical protein
LEEAAVWISKIVDMGMRIRQGLRLEIDIDMGAMKEDRILALLKVYCPLPNGLIT